ncbi:MAG TPA: SpoIID/LytB domain-containing protein [Candidatus Ozemobacteraceae bacterium]|nr:SpoIID/LytB domain-containing protein [Candidatus Ozemobacteraceae bacterium]
MRDFRPFLIAVAILLATVAAVPSSAFQPLKRQMRIGLYHLGVPRQFQVFSADGPLEVYDPFSRRILLSGPASSATVLCQNGTMQVFMDSLPGLSAPNPLVFSSLGKTTPFVHLRTPPYRGETYRGSVAIAPWRDRLFAVNLIDIEEYLRSVVPAEIGGTVPTAALEAQAVAARSYALRNHLRHSTNGFDLCDEVHCQVYRGIRTETAAASNAVHRTAGWVLTFNSYMANTVYHANCGGNLVSSQKVWKGAAVPYLTDHPDAIGTTGFFCAPAPPKKNGKKAPPPPPPTARGSHPSRGHRVGMCQDGAIGMAKAGHSAVAILGFYYPGTTLSGLTAPAQLAHLTRAPGSATVRIAAPRFGSGPIRIATRRPRVPGRLPIARTPAEKPLKAAEVASPLHQNLRKWFWTALAPHDSPRDVKLAAVPERKAVTISRKGRKQPSPKRVATAIPRKSAKKSGGAAPRKSARRNANP